MAISTRANIAFYNGGNGAAVFPLPTIANSGGYRLEVNQLMLLTVIVKTNTAGTITTPTGWVAVNASSPISSSSGAIYQYIKIATASDIIAGSVSVTTSYTNDMIFGFVRTYRGFNTSSTTANSISAGTDNVNKYKLAGALTPSAIGALPIVVAVNSNSANMAAIPPGWTPIQFNYPANNFYNVFAAEGPLTTDTTTPINPQLVWGGQYSNFQMVTSLTLINPAAIIPVPLSPTEPALIAAAIGSAQVEAAVTGGSPAPAISVRDACKLVGAVAFGVCSGAATSSPSYSDMSGTRQRVTHTLDSDNNRTGVTTSTT